MVDSRHSRIVEKLEESNWTPPVFERGGRYIAATRMPGRDNRGRRQYMPIGDPDGYDTRVEAEDAAYDFRAAGICEQADKTGRLAADTLDPAVSL